jgi:hypothetical protein
MSEREAEETPVPSEPEFDENGVDLGQIRNMLDVSPAERLTLATQFLNSLLEIRTRNGIRGSA